LSGSACFDVDQCPKRDCVVLITEGWDEREARITSLPVSTTRTMEHGTEGDKAKPLGVGALAALLFGAI
jgi:hypothetical protein